MSNKADSGALAIARNRGVPAIHLAQQDFATAEEFDSSVFQALSQYRVEFIALAGYLKMLSPKIIREFRHRILNIHPALLPAFGGKGMYGIRVHQAVLDYGCKVSGVTVHLVEDGFDTGPPVLQRCVLIEDGDTAETLAARVLETEHALYPEALQLFAERRVEIEGRNVRITR